eukprot:3771237-Alexandrium_andersonii.AAC.1
MNDEPYASVLPITSPSKPDEGVITYALLRGDRDIGFLDGQQLNVTNLPYRWSAASAGST